MKLKFWLAASVAVSFSLGASAQKSIAERLADLKTAGYPDVRALSFLDTKKQYALTGLYRNETDKDPQLYFAMISPNKDGASMAFKTNRPCAPNEKVRSLQQRIVSVSGQKIEAYYVCSAGPGVSETQEVFLIKSTAGNDFVKKEFAENEYVFVQVSDLPVPFQTNGFSGVLAQSSGKAL